MKLKILNIYENDYGCEESTEETKYIVVVADENSNESEILLTDAFLTANGLDENVIFDSDILNGIL